MSDVGFNPQPFSSELPPIKQPQTDSNKEVGETPAGRAVKKVKSDAVKLSDISPKASEPSELPDMRSHVVRRLSESESPVGDHLSPREFKGAASEDELNVNDIEDNDDELEIPQKRVESEEIALDSDESSEISEIVYPQAELNNPNKLTFYQLKNATQEVKDRLATATDGAPTAKLEVQLDTLKEAVNKREGINAGMDAIHSGWKSPDWNQGAREAFQGKLRELRTLHSDIKQLQTRLANPGFHIKSDLDALVGKQQALSKIGNEARPLLLGASSSQRKEGLKQLAKVDPSTITSHRSNIVNILHTDINRVSDTFREGIQDIEITFANGSKGEAHIRDVLDSICNSPLGREALDSHPRLKQRFESCYLEVATQKTNEVVEQTAAFYSRSLDNMRGIVDRMKQRQTEGYSASVELQGMSFADIKMLSEAKVDTYLESVGLLGAVGGLGTEQRQVALEQLLESQRKEPVTTVVVYDTGAIEFESVVGGAPANLQALGQARRQLIQDPEAFIQTNRFKPQAFNPDTLDPESRAIYDRQTPEQRKLFGKGNDEQALESWKSGHYLAGYNQASGLWNQSAENQRNVAVAVAKDCIREGIQALRSEGLISIADAAVLKDVLNKATEVPERPDFDTLTRLLHDVTERSR